MIEFQEFLRQLKQPEYVHVLLNPIPVYGMMSGILALVIALILKSRPAQISALVVVIFAALSVWPVGEFGDRASDRVYAMSNKDAQQWLDVHMHRADIGSWVFYATALVAMAALVLPRFRPRTQLPLTLATLVFALASLGAGAWISHAGGKVRHSEFREGPPPHPVRHEEEH
jgi:predicted ABC-type exoprotein transport system permease subunit